MKDIFFGTELELELYLQPMGGLTSDDYDFVVEVYCFPKRTVTYTKSELTRKDSDRWGFILDTAEIGVGPVNIKVTAQIPNAMCKDGYRKEVAYLMGVYNIERGA